VTARDTTDVATDASPERLRRRAVGVVAMTIAVLSFSVSSPLIKWSGETGSVIAFWRMIGAAVAWWAVLFVLRHRSGRSYPSATTWRMVAPAGLFFGANIALFFTAVTRTSIAHAEFIAALAPLILLPAGAFLFGEHPNWGALRFGLISIVGVAMVLFFGHAGGDASVGGDLLMIVVVALWTGYLLASKRALRTGIDTIDFMSCVMPLGMLTAGPIALVIAGGGVLDLGAKGWVVVLAMTVLTGMVAHGCIVVAQGSLPVASIGVMQTAQPALAVLWGFIFLGEDIGALQVVGMALVMFGLGLFTWKSQADRSVPDPTEPIPNER
jgi:drug/metabolite transporter (DMT)-like permease